MSAMIFNIASLTNFLRHFLHIIGLKANLNFSFYCIDDNWMPLELNVQQWGDVTT